MTEEPFVFSKVAGVENQLAGGETQRRMLVVQTTDLLKIAKNWAWEIERLLTSEFGGTNK